MLTPSASPTPPRRRAWWLRPEVALATLAMGAYSYFYQAGGWNQNVRYDLIRAFVEERGVRITRNHENTGDKARRGRHYYADKAPGVSFLAVPVYAAFYWAQGEWVDRDRFQIPASYVCTLWAVALPSALAVAALYSLLRALTLVPAAAAAVVVAYALGTLAFPYSTVLYGHQTAAALLLSAFALAVRARRSGHERGRSRLAAIGLLLGAAVAVEYPAALGAGVIAAYALRGRVSSAAWLAAGAALPLALLGAYHSAAFGGPFTLPYSFSTQTHRHQGFFMGLGKPDPAVVLELLFGYYRGLFHTAPWLLAAVPGAACWLANRRTRSEGAVCLAIPLLYLWLNASLNDWHGGHGIGPRHLIPALPFLAVLAAGLLARDAVHHVGSRYRGAMVTVGLAAVALSMGFMVTGTAVGPEVSWRIGWPLEGEILPAFREGRLALNTQGVDMVARRGTVRKAWNVGEKLGLGGRATLFPLAVFAGAAGAWLVLAVRREAEAGAATPSSALPAS